MINFNFGKTLGTFLSRLPTVAKRGDVDKLKLKSLINKAGRDAQEHNIDV